MASQNPFIVSQPVSPSPIITWTETMIDESTIDSVAAGLDQVNFHNLLRFLDDNYHNDAALISDLKYDSLRHRYTQTFGPYKYIGAPPRGPKVKLPYFLSSLDKPETEEQFDRWMRDFPGPYVIEDKIDGATILILSTVTDGVRTTHIYTRGGGTEGEDVSHIVDLIQVPSWLRPRSPISEDIRTHSIAVRGEIVITKANFEKIRAIGGYKNARNAVAGAMRAKQSFNPAVAREMSFFGYRILNFDGAPSDHIRALQALGFDVPNPVVTPSVTYSQLEQYLTQRKSQGAYDLDGLVIYQDTATPYPAYPYNPAHIIAFKPKHMLTTAITTVIRVEWEGSKERKLKPTVVYEPVELYGATLQRSTGHNARFILMNSIGPGAQIELTRAGETIPYIVRTITPAPNGPAYPDPREFGVYRWNENQVELVMDQDNDQTITNILSHFVTTLGIKNMGEERLKILVSHGIRSVDRLLHLTPEWMQQLPGLGEGISTQFLRDLHAKMAQMPVVDLMAGLHFFPGIGRRRFEQIFDAYPTFLESARAHPEMVGGAIMNLNGFGEELTGIILRGLPEFLSWLSQHPEIHLQPIVIPPSIDAVAAASSSIPSLVGVVATFSGIRDKDLENAIKARGGKGSASMTRATNVLVMKNPAETGVSKAVEAIKRGIPIMSMQQFREHYQV